MLKPENRHIVIILLLGVALRVIVFMLMQPTLYPDSLKYMEVARMFTNGDLSEYGQFGLAPGYPLVIAMFGGNLQALTIFQMLIGLATSVLLYHIFGMLIGHGRLALAGALCYALSPFQAAFERDILTESLSTFLTVLSVYFLFRIWKERSGTGGWVMLGLAATLAAFARPMLQILPPLVAGAAAVAYYRRPSESGAAPAAGRLALALLPAILIIGGWSAYNYHRFNYPGLTILAGLHTTNITGAFMEKAPAEYSDIASIYLRHRSAVSTQKYSQVNTIWSALPDLEAETGLSPADLSRKFGHLSLILILNNPGTYLRYAAKGFVIFWLPCWYVGKDGLLPTLRSGSLPERLLLWPLSLFQALLTGLFLFLPVALLLSHSLREAIPLDFGFIALYLIVLSTAFSSSLVEFGSNDRFEQSVEPFVLGIGLFLLTRLYSHFCRRTGPEAAER